MIKREIDIKRIKDLLFETDSCIEYPIKNKEGYGMIQFKIENKKYHYLAHRLSFEISNFVELESSDIICHNCDNPACINPRHLFKGTHKDNVEDRVKKNRSAKGRINGRYIHGYNSKYEPIEKPKAGFEKLFNRKLDKEQVLEVKNLINKNVPLKQISEVLGISYNTIRDIKSKRVYSKI